MPLTAGFNARAAQIKYGTALVNRREDLGYEREDVAFNKRLQTSQNRRADRQGSHTMAMQANQDRRAKEEAALARGEREQKMRAAEQEIQRRERLSKMTVNIRGKELPLDVDPRVFNAVITAANVKQKMDSTDYLTQLGKTGNTGNYEPPS